MEKTPEQIRLEAARLLLGRGIRFIIKDAPFLYRLFRLNRISIHHLKAGTIMEISRLVDENKLYDIRVPIDANKRLDALALIIATAVLNRKDRIEKEALKLSRFLLWKVPAQTLIDIYQTIAPVTKIMDFMTITRFFEIQAQTMMNPKNLTTNPGQTKKGS